MRLPFLVRLLPVVGLALILTCVIYSDASERSSSITGRVVDAKTNKPIPGNVVVALESQPGDGMIVNATSPDAKGTFSFTNVRAGNYAIVIAAMDVNKRSYVPVLVVGKGVVPGAEVGTIAMKTAPNNAKVNVPVQSNKPITVTLALNQKIGSYSFAIPWADGTPTVDTEKKKRCAAGTACTAYTVQVPSSGMLMAEFNGQKVQYLSNSLPTKYSVIATAYMQNGAKPTCTSHNSAPVEVDLAGKQSSTQTISFEGCE